jgi:2-dehydropantoate 2-reductase
MRILMVGAGAVGQVYARHLAAAGHEITFFVKPKYAAELATGMPLHRLRHFGTRSELWSNYQVVSTTAEVAAQAHDRPWDQLWLCMASDALRSTLTTEVLAQAGATTVVCLQPGPEDAERIRTQLADPQQLVRGLITFISYQSPLPGRAGPQGMAYYLPPLAPGLFSGEGQRVLAVVEALKKGGMAARIVNDLDEASGGADGALIPLIAGLEQNAWKLGDFGGSSALATARAAGLEALAVLAGARGARVGPQRWLLSGPATTLLLFLAPKVLPLALEPYLEYHFSKVGVQTRQMLESYIAMGERQALPVEQLRRLRAGLH